MKKSANSRSAGKVARRDLPPIASLRFYGKKGDLRYRIYLAKRRHAQQESADFFIDHTVALNQPRIT
ncbi:hypothetical protein Y032_0034g2922 [Ancylostoma ceylanicum]|uniref:Uncharacterized protein n=1 Tax=Ancylostoma ceylanicum TaxID=53326 RepID=A0A016UN09_9BILA|nr:hypothetical protein Y032_0034g2922 [Ancylostoma ceylanicum]